MRYGWTSREYMLDSTEANKCGNKCNVHKLLEMVTKHLYNPQDACTCMVYLPTSTIKHQPSVGKDGNFPLPCYFFGEYTQFKSLNPTIHFDSPCARRGIRPESPSNLWVARRLRGLHVTNTKDWNVHSDSQPNMPIWCLKGIQEGANWGHDSS